MVTTINYTEAKPGHPRILCIPDRPDWIFNRHVLMLERYLGDEFEFSVVYRGQDYVESNFDLIYPLEFNLVDPQQIIRPEKYISGIRSFISWVDYDFLKLVDMLRQRFQRLHVISRQLLDIFNPYLPGLQYVTQGVDLQFFKATAPPSDEPGRLRLGWAGNRQSIVKGFQEFIQPLAEIPGVELSVVGFADQNLKLADMPGFYQSIDAIVSASSYEGGNNSIMEAAAMERGIITTANGTALEYLQDGISALIVRRDVDQLRAAVTRLRDEPTLRLSLGRSARQSLVDGGWEWAVKAEDFRLFFRQSLDKGMSSAPGLAPGRLAGSEDDRHYAGVLQIQYELERELHISHARSEFDRRLEIDELKRQLEELRNSETYRLGEKLKSLPGASSIIRLYQARKKTT